MRSIDDFTRPLENISPMDDPLGLIVRDWAEKYVIPHRRKFDEDYVDHKFIEPAFDKLMGEMGMQRVLFPENMGGWGFGRSDHVGTSMYRIMEEVARADSGMAVAYGVVYWPLLMIAVEPHVNYELCKEFAPIFCDTEEARFAANAMTEPQGGSDIENMEILGGSTIQTTAVLDGDEWVINGHKLWPTNSGGVCNLFGVVCTTNPGSRDPDDFAFIFVPADTPGCTQGPPYQKAGMAADKNGDIWFENVRVPKSYRAHGPGLDAMYFKEMVSLGNMASTAFVGGVLLNVWERLYEFVSEETYKGQPLKEHDAVAGLLADIARDAEVVRIVGYQNARMMDRPDIYGARWSDEQVAKARLYKYWSADVGMETLGKAMNLMSVYGADRDWDIEKHWRDLKIVQLWLGGKQLGQAEVARWFWDLETV
ncbi:MAG: acyl-CoA dehydrogenase [Actinobacteria bacterium]|jgi:alkylation response protein AidB-like acyl-CoA dehydrogenase|nr:MAG: acyl-CoA dehydrogenase [Actinomycetota bacterium]